MSFNQNILNERDEALLQLGISVFRDPGILVQAHWYNIRDKMYVALHQHADLLQLDLMVGMTGAVTVQGKEIPLSGTMLFAFYPGIAHELRMAPESGQGEFYSIKIRVSRKWSAIQKRIFPPYLKLPVADFYLVKALRQLNLLSKSLNVLSSARCATICEVFSYWPAVGVPEEVVAIEEAGDDIGGGMRKALDLIYKKTSGVPPSVQELSRVAGMSSRNFLRRFQELFYCAPRAYIAKHRLVCAKELLSHQNYRVTEIAEKLGFPSIHSFSRWFQRKEGISPSAYREKHFLL